MTNTLIKGKNEFWNTFVTQLFAVVDIKPCGECPEPMRYCPDGSVIPCHEECPHCMETCFDCDGNPIGDYPCDECPEPMRYCPDGSVIPCHEECPQPCDCTADECWTQCEEQGYENGGSCKCETNDYDEECCYCECNNEPSCSDDDCMSQFIETGICDGDCVQVEDIDGDYNCVCKDDEPCNIFDCFDQFLNTGECDGSCILITNEYGVEFCVCNEPCECENDCNQWCLAQLNDGERIYEGGDCISTGDGCECVCYPDDDINILPCEEMDCDDGKKMNVRFYTGFWSANDESQVFEALNIIKDVVGENSTCCNGALGNGVHDVDCFKDNNDSFHLDICIRGEEKIDEIRKEIEKRWTEQAVKSIMSHGITCKVAKEMMDSILYFVDIREENPSTAMTNYVDEADCLGHCYGTMSNVKDGHCEKLCGDGNWATLKRSCYCLG